MNYTEISQHIFKSCSFRNVVFKIIFTYTKKRSKPEYILSVINFLTQDKTFEIKLLRRPYYSQGPCIKMKEKRSSLRFHFLKLDRLSDSTFIFCDQNNQQC